MKWLESERRKPGSREREVRTSEWHDDSESPSPRKEGRKGDEKGEAWNVKEESKNESSAKDAVAITSSPEESTELFRKESFT